MTAPDAPENGLPLSVVSAFRADVIGPAKAGHYEDIDLWRGFLHGVDWPVQRNSYDSRAIRRAARRLA